MRVQHTRLRVWPQAAGKQAGVLGHGSTRLCSCRHDAAWQSQLSLLPALFSSKAGGVLCATLGTATLPPRGPALQARVYALRSELNCQSNP